MKLGDKNNALVAMVVVAVATHPGTARAEDVAAEIHLLKEQVKQLEPLKERLKQLEAEVAKEKRERKEARGGVRNAAAQPGPGGQGLCVRALPARRRRQRLCVRMVAVRRRLPRCS
jgi:hypothetical protein